MSKSYTVAEGYEFNYPANQVSEQIIKNAGGRSKLTEEQKSLCSFKTVIENQDCSDMPEDIRNLYIERGWIIVKDSEEFSESEPREES